MSSDVERLVMVFDARFDALEAKLDKIVARNQKAAKDVQDAWTKMPLGAALKDMADRVGETATKLPGLGAALEALGPAGLAATVAIGAFLATLEAGKKALEFGDNIAKAAEKIGVSTTTLQEYRFVVQATGGTTQDADASMQKFQQTLGQGALGATRAKLAFNALHLDAKALAKEGLDKALDTTVDALSRVGSEAERQGLAAKLGLEPFIAAIREGPEAVKALKAAIEEGGGILPPEIAEQSKAATVQLDALAQVAKNQLTAAFVGVAPLLIEIAEWFAIGTKFAGDFAQEIGKELTTALRDSAVFFDAWNTKFAEWSAQLEKAIPFLKTVEDTLNQINRGWTSGGGKGFSFAGVPGVTGGPTDFLKNEFGTVLPNMKSSMDKMVAAVGEAAKNAAGQGTNVPGSLARPHAAPADKTQQLLQDATAALANAMKAELQSTLALTTNIDERARIEVGIAQEEYVKTIAELEKKREAADKEKSLRDPAIRAKINADLTEAEQAAANAEMNKELLSARQALVAHLQVENTQAAAETALREVGMKAQADHLTALASLSDITSEQNAFQRQALIAAQAREDDAAAAAVETAKNAYAQALAMQDFDKSVTAATNLLKAQADQTALGAAHKDALTLQAKAQEDPFQKWADSAKNFNQVAMEDGVKAFDSLTSGLADAIVHAKNLGDVGKSVFQQLAVDLIDAFLKKELASSVMSVVSHFASGDMTGAASGLAVVGEDGPELVNLPGGSRILNNNQLRQVGMGASGSTGQTIVFDNRGAVIWEQAAKAMMAYADRSAAMAGVGAVQLSRQATPADLARASARSLG